MYFCSGRMPKGLGLSLCLCLCLEGPGLGLKYLALTVYCVTVYTLAQNTAKHDRERERERERDRSSSVFCSLSQFHAVFLPCTAVFGRDLDISPLDIFPQDIFPRHSSSWTVASLFTWCRTFPPSTTTIRQSTI